MMVLLLSAVRMVAEDVIITVTPTKRVLPPQIESYLTKPDQFFTVSIANITNEEQDIYLSLEIEHINPNDGLRVATPNDYQPKAPFKIPANGSYTLTMLDMKNLFQHIPSNAMQIPDGLMDGYMNGSFGLLPEGEYEAHFQAYKWREPKYAAPVPCSNAMGGRNTFVVCYKAQAPTFITPLLSTPGDDMSEAELSIHNPLFTWTQPVITCSPSAFTYTYDLRIVELIDGQEPDVAMDRNPVVYQKTDQMSPMVLIDKVTLDTKFSKDKTYVAQVTAKQTGGSVFDYVMLENQGKSPLRKFKLVDRGKFSVTMDGMEESGDINLGYNFRNPDIISPAFKEGEVRRMYQESDFYVSWKPAWFLDGEGENPYDLKMDYTVQLYNGGAEADMEKALAKEPIFTATTSETEYEIPWDQIKGKVKLKDYLVLRVQPKCTNSEKVTFSDEEVNVRDFTLSEHISPRFFQCSNKIVIENTEPTTKKASDFVGKEVGLGQFQLTIDKIEKGNAKEGFTGRGRVKWELPMGTAMVHVKFDTLRINTDDIAFGGLATSCADETKMTNYEAVEHIFSDLGIENMLAKTGVPFADIITEESKKTISEEIDGIANYYSVIKSCGNINDLLGGGTADVYTPICLPKDKFSELNSSPVDIQITTIKFAPTWATMDMLGEFTMPKSECLASDLLVFGAPRLCIEPKTLIPEAGTLALLGNFTVTDPNTKYECTFKAPADLLSPTDGCYVAWKGYKFETMGVDIDMKLPGLKKYDTKADKATDEMPILNMKGSIASWDDFVLDEVKIDPFEADKLPGFTFTCSDVAFDHSLTRTADAMTAYSFPKEYNKQEGIGQDIYQHHGNYGWEGLYVGKISVAMPKGITGGDGRLKITGSDMLVDQSGVTMDADLQQLINASVGDFSFEINRVGLTFIQNNFDNCHIDGKLSVPLLKNEKKEASVIGLTCQIRKQIDEKGKKGEEFVYVFNTKSLNGDYTLDLFLAKLTLEEKLTYLLVEAEPKKQASGENKLTTRCELLLGGKMGIGDKEVKDSWNEALVPFNISIPDIHFVGMRLANCKPWKSKYVDIQADIEKERKEQEKNAQKGHFHPGKEIHNGKKDDGSDATFFFHTGSWSLASAKKKLGPFEFSLEDYDIKKSFSGSTLTLKLNITGKVALVKGIDISADANFDIKGKMTNIGADLSKISGSFDGIDAKKIGVDASFCGIGLKGSVEFVNSGDNPDVGKGFAASLDITLPGNLFTVHGDGGYFDYDSGSEQYSWGWVHVALSGNIVLGPCSITKLGGGFYMNCSRNPAGDNEKPKNVAGLVGIFLELGMASPDGATIKGDMTLNVVYNRKRKCLSNFAMTGNLKAVGGIINSNMTLVYENSPSDRYLQINITVDAALSAESMAGSLDSFGANLGTIKDQMKQLAGDKFKDPIADCKQGLSSKIGANATDADADKDPSEIKTAEEDPNKVASNSKTSKQGGLPKMGATISLDVRITWKQGGTDYAKKPKWHVYLGEPAEDKRCTLTLIQFDSPVVSCHVGANAYICVGNELPNNGELPPLPAKIAKFLDGSKHGDFQSDNASQAQAVRQQALQGFNGDISGGVMLGAMGYGDIRINLGLIEGKLEAILGFDVSVVHYKNGYCVNLGKIPGYKGWYGRGQLYAYLYMLLALHFNLGFIDYDFNLAEAEIGGVLKMGGPSPNYFQGKARAKISLLSGLFKFDKSFEFDCGQYCQLFKGNPLDDFILFDDCSLGDTIRSKGWTEDKAGTVSISADMQPKVKVNIRTPQYANTKAPLTEHFRLLDENELERIAGQFGEGSKEWEDSKMQAKRTFIFRDFGEVWLFEYNSPSQYKPHSSLAENATFHQKQSNAMEYCGASYRYSIPLEKGGSKSRRYIDLGTLRAYLKPGKFYRLVAAGYAKEILKGKEEDPFTYYNGGKNKGNIAWVKAAEYYFQTEKENIVNDKAPLQDYVAIAYPSHYNMLRSPESDVDSKTGAVKHLDAYLGDVQAPTIALTEDIRTKAFKKGKLYWRLLSPMGKQLDIVENVWVEGNPLGNGNIRTINMEPKRKLNAKANEKYILQLDYYTLEYLAEDEFNPDSKKWQTMDTTLVKLYVKTLASNLNWQTGKATNDIHSCIYDQPFIAQKITGVNISRPYGSKASDADILKSNYFTKCPMTYIGYMSNFAFPAGWEITERGYFGIEVTTSESLLFHDPGNGGKYEGVYNESDTYRTYNAFDEIQKTFVYVIPGSKTNGVYDVTVQYPLSHFWHENGYGDWDYVHDVDERIEPYSPSMTKNYNYSVSPALSSISKVYNVLHASSVAINNTAAHINYLQGRESSEKSKKSALKEWYGNHRGTYVNEYEGFVYSVDPRYYFYVPAYQFPVIWSICTLEGINGAYKGMSKNNDRAKNGSLVWQKMVADNYNERQYFNETEAKKNFHYADVVAYRVNAYDVNAGHYYVANNLLNGLGQFAMRSYKPFYDRNTQVIVTYSGNTSGTSEGKTTGASSVTGVNTNVSTTSLTADQLDKMLQSILEMHDSCRVIYNVQQKYWPRYQKLADQLTKPATKAETYAKASVAAYFCATSDRLEKSNKYATQAVAYIKEAKTYRDSINRALNNVSPTGAWKATSPVTNQYGSFRSIRKMTESINYYMDRYITPQSDPNSTQYQRYRAMQDEAKGWDSQLQTWRDSIYNSLNGSWDGPDGKEYGYCKTYVDKYLWADNHLKNKTPRNYDKTQEELKEVTGHANGAATTQRKAQKAIEEALAAINDARKKLGKAATFTIPDIQTEDIVNYVVTTNPDFAGHLQHVSEQELKGAIVHEVLKDQHQVTTGTLVNPNREVADVAKLTAQKVDVGNVMDQALANLASKQTVSLHSNMPSAQSMTNVVATEATRKANTAQTATSIRSIVIGNSDGGGTAYKVSRGTTAEKAGRTMGTKLTQIIQAAQKSIEELETYIQNRQDALADFEVVRQKQKLLQEYGASLDASLYFIGGADGESGEKAKFLEVCNEQSCPYKNACTYYDRIKAIREEVSEDSTIIVNQMNRLPTAEEVKAELEKAKLELDKAMGRDRNAAERELQRLDSLISAVQLTVSKYESGTLRKERNAKLRKLYNMITQGQEAYLEGDLAQLAATLDLCAEFESEFTEYKADFDAVEGLYNGLESLPEPVWAGMAQAGYPEDHELVQSAKQKWAAENMALQIRDIYKDYLLINSNLNSYSAVVANVHREAEKYQQDPAELMDKVGEYALKKLVSMKNATEYSDPSFNYGNEFNNSVEYIKQIKEKYTGLFEEKKMQSQAEWDKYTTLLLTQETPSSYRSALQQTIDQCTQAEETIRAMEVDFMRSGEAPLLHAADSIKQADYYLNLIPTENPSPSNESALYFAKIMHEKVVKYYQQFVDAREDFLNYCSKIMPTRYDREVAPIKRDAVKALNYLNQFGGPQRLPEHLISAYNKQIDQIAADVESTKTRFTSQMSALNTSLSRLSTAYQKMNQKRQALQTKKGTATKAELTSMISDIAPYIETVLTGANDARKKITQMDEECETALSKLNQAKEARNYIQQQTRESILLNSVNTRVDKIDATVRSIVNSQPTLKSRLAEVQRKATEAKQLEEEIAEMRRTLSTSSSTTSSPSVRLPSTRVTTSTSSSIGRKASTTATTAKTRK